MRSSKGKQVKLEGVDSGLLGEVLDTGRELDEELERVRRAEKSREEKVKKPKTNVSSENVQETVRDTVFGAIGSHLQPKLADATEDEKKKHRVEKRRRELRNFLENLADAIQDKTADEAAAEFSSMLNIASQLSLQKTEAVITVHCRLRDFMDGLGDADPHSRDMRQEISLIFSPEETEAIRERAEEIGPDDPLRPFFTTILDQAFDTGQYNEITGAILVEMTRYFLDKLEYHGYDTHTQVADFKARHDRTMNPLAKAIEELRAVQDVLENHIMDHPVLVDFPRALRLLIQIRLGMLPHSMAAELVETVRSKQGEYARARSAVGFDFNRLPSFQHEVHLRQSAILSLHKSVLSFTAKEFQAEFEHAKAELDGLLADIEAASEKLDTRSPEYQRLLKQKERLHKKIAEQRRDMDVLGSQQKFVDIQHSQVQKCLEHFKNQEQSTQDAIDSHHSAKIDPNKARKAQTGESSRKPQSRMATATYRKR